jgi:CRP/FNR family transcriptional regulator, cyclic AMP receptor protein
MKQALEVLGRVPLFAGLPPEVLAKVAERCVLRTLPRETQLFRTGEACRGFYLLVEGSVRIYRSNADGREQVLHTQGPGQTIAEVPLFDGGPYPASARAMEESRVLFLPIGDFQSLYRTHPEIADTVIRELGRRLRRMVGLVEKISLKDVHARVAMTLLEYASRESVQPADGVSFELPRTGEQLAAELATTRESISRALSRLRKEGVIDGSGSRIRIASVKRLRAMATAGG